MRRPRMNCTSSARTCRTTASRRVCYRVECAETANERKRGLPLAGEVMRWLFSGKGMLTYSLSIVAASVKVPEESATSDMEVTFAPAASRAARSANSKETPGPQRRRLADAPPVARLCRGQVGPARRHAGDQPAPPLGRKRPTCHHRRLAAGSADGRDTRLAAVRPGRNSTRCVNPDGRRIARLRRAQRLHLLSRQLHLHDGLAPDERRG